MAYRQRILDACPPGSNFQPLMTAYLTETLDPDDLAAGHAAGDLTAVKLYPAGATTNSDAGVRDIRKVDATLKRMAEIGMPLLVHGEVTDPAIDIFDREAVFIERVLKPLMDRLPDLKIVLEHITTRQAVDYVATAGDHLAATITPHHMEINRTDIFRGGIRPHLYCLPIAKRFGPRQSVAIPGFSWERIQHRIRFMRKKPPADVRASTTRRAHCRSMPECSRPTGPWTSWKDLPA